MSNSRRLVNDLISKVEKSNITYSQARITDNCGVNPKNCVNHDWLLQLPKRKRSIYIDLCKKRINLPKAMSLLGLPLMWLKKYDGERQQLCNLWFYIRFEKLVYDAMPEDYKGEFRIWDSNECYGWRSDFVNLLAQQCGYKIGSRKFNWLAKKAARMYWSEADEDTYHTSSRNPQSGRIPTFYHFRGLKHVPVSKLSLYFKGLKSFENACKGYKSSKREPKWKELVQIGRFSSVYDRVFLCEFIKRGERLDFKALRNFQNLPVEQKASKLPARYAWAILKIDPTEIECTEKGDDLWEVHPFNTYLGKLVNCYSDDYVRDFYKYSLGEGDLQYDLTSTVRNNPLVKMVMDAFQKRYGSLYSMNWDLLMYNKDNLSTLLKVSMQTLLPALRGNTDVMHEIKVFDKNTLVAKEEHWDYYYRNGNRINVSNYHPDTYKKVEYIDEKQMDYHLRTEGCNFYIKNNQVYAYNNSYEVGSEEGELYLVKGKFRTVGDYHLLYAYGRRVIGSIHKVNKIDYHESFSNTSKPLSFIIRKREEYKIARKKSEALIYSIKDKVLKESMTFKASLKQCHESGMCFEGTVSFLKKQDNKKLYNIVSKFLSWNSLLKSIPEEYSKVRDVNLNWESEQYQLERLLSLNVDRTKSFKDFLCANVVYAKIYEKDYVETKKVRRRRNNRRRIK